ncbi:helix-turn-helix domain-containing protein [Isoptericola rhizosphaerae]|uniref:helix-turn-helix domain-containing protein n=1 Tax=Isoptericola rhizosphaerae TaxID=3377837 RepID=UPI00383BB9B1
MGNTESALGQNVRRLREAAGLSQAHVADAMAEAGIEGFYPQTVLKVEKGTRALKFVEGLELARVLGVEPQHLYSPAPQTAVLAGLRAGTRMVERRRQRYLQAMYDLAVSQGQLQQVLGDGDAWEGLASSEELKHVRQIAAAAPEDTFRWAQEHLKEGARSTPSPLQHLLEDSGEVEHVQREEAP